MAAGRKDRAPGVVDIDASPLAALAKRARLTLVWERLWPRLAPLPAWSACSSPRAGSACFPPCPTPALGCSSAFSALRSSRRCWPLASLRYPTIRDALGRLDRETGLDHRPASTLADRLATGPSDPVSRALWEAHLRAARAKAGAIRLGLPSPGLPAVDRYALRMALMLALVVGFFYAGAERMPRLAVGLQRPVRGSSRGAGPHRCLGHSAEPIRGARRSSSPQSAAGPSLRSRRTASWWFASRAMPAPRSFQAARPGIRRGRHGARAGEPAIEKRLALKGDAAVTVRRGGRDVAGFRFSIIPDNPPTIAFEGPIKTAARGAMTLTYKVEDDYGVVGAEAEVTLPPKAGARPLYDPPKLPLFRTDGAQPERRCDIDPRRLRASFRGGAGDDDAGGPRRCRQSRPQRERSRRPFRAGFSSSLLARALVEQRRNLALDAGQKAMVGEALVGPDDRARGFHQGCRHLSRPSHSQCAPADARTDEQLRGVVDYLWQIALRIEEGDLSRCRSGR